MPKDEFDFEDPFELNGMAFLSHEDTTNDMAECFTEEFMRMGYGHKQVLAIKLDPEVVSKDDVEMLQDLIVAAIGDAHRKVDEALASQMQGLMGGLRIPGLS